MLTKTLAALTAALMTLSLTGTARANADRVVGEIAAHQVQGWVDNATPAPVLEQRIAQGGRVYVTCSIVADLAVRAARRHGIPARHVSVLTAGAFDGYDDGHAMLELKLGGHWVLYDPDMNRVAVDRDGHRIGLAAQVRAGSVRRWRMIAHDSDHSNLTGTSAGIRAAVKHFEAIRPAAWYTHIMGVALIETASGQYAYNAPRHSARVEAVWPGQYHWVNAAAWRALSA